MPFEGPRHETGPDVDRQASADEDAGPGRTTEIVEGGQLRHPDRFVRDEAVGRDDLHDRPVRVAPEIALHQHGEAGELLRRNRSIPIGRVGQTELALRPAGRFQPQVEGTG